MSSCARCGHELGDGRFCTSCGAPAEESVDDYGDWRTDTAERPLGPSSPGSTRFPLFADEVPPAPAAEPESATPGRVLPPPPPAPADPATHHRRRPPFLPWVIGIAALALVAGLGAWLLFSGGDDPAGKAEESPVGQDRGSPQPEPSDTAGSATPSEDTVADNGSGQSAGKPTDLAGSAAVSAPRSAAPSQDTKGNTVTYDAGNMVDSDPTTAWRMPGNGVDERITFRFDQPVRLRRVGLINGYAKTGSSKRGAIDWYSGNRRIKIVEWSFGDGTVVTQRLGDTRLMQTKKVGGVETRKVTLRLVKVSPPGKGRASRNYTAISGVQLVGTTA